MINVISESVRDMNIFSVLVSHVFSEISVPEFRVRCVCHMVNNICESGIVDEDKLVDRVREVVKTVKRPKAKKVFRGLLTDERKKKVNLPLDCKTRWNSTLTMIERAYEMRSELQRYA